MYKQTKNLIAPPFLQPGDRVGLICPSGYMEPSHMDDAERALKGEGWEVVRGVTAGNQHHYFSGTDEVRLNDLQQMLDNPSIKAIFCGRGGYGLSRIVEQIDWTAFDRQPKWMVGYSDITILLNAVERRGVQSIHGPMAAAFQADRSAVYRQYARTSIDALKGLPAAGFSPEVHRFERTVEAPVTGGNLCLLAHLCGNRFNRELVKGKILFVEDIGEYIYGADRYLWQLKREGIFDALAALLIGGFTDMKDTTVPFGMTMRELLHSHFDHAPYPVVYDFPVGHQAENMALRIGHSYTLTTGPEGCWLKG